MVEKKQNSPSSPLATTSDLRIASTIIPGRPASLALLYDALALAFHFHIHPASLSLLRDRLEAQPPVCIHSNSTKRHPVTKNRVKCVPPQLEFLLLHIQIASYDYPSNLFLLPNAHPRGPLQISPFPPSLNLGGANAIKLRERHTAFTFLLPQKTYSAPVSPRFFRPTLAVPQRRLCTPGWNLIQLQPPILQTPSTRFSIIHSQSQLCFPLKLLSRSFSLDRQFSSLLLVLVPTPLVLPPSF